MKHRTRKILLRFIVLPVISLVLLVVIAKPLCEVEHLYVDFSLKVGLGKAAKT